MVTLLDKIKSTKIISELTSETQKFFDLLKEQNTTNWNNKTLLAFFESNKLALGELNDGFESFLITADPTKDLMEQYQQHLSKASSANAKFAASLKTLATKLGIMLAITVAIKAVSAAFDYLNVTLEEQQEIVDNLSDKISSLQSEYDDLSSKGALSDIDQQRLEYLKRQIALNEQILAQENEKLALKKLYGKGDLFSTGELKSVGLSDSKDAEMDYSQ